MQSVQNLISFVLGLANLGTDRGFISKRLNEHTAQLLIAWGFDQARVAQLNQKAIKRAVELASFATAPTADAVANSSGLRASLMVALGLGQYDAGHRVAMVDLHATLNASKGREGCKALKNARRLVAVFGAIEPGSVSSMVSRSIGKRGFIPVDRADRSHIVTSDETARVCAVLVGALEKIEDKALRGAWEATQR